LPYSIRILLESAIRNCDNFQVTKEDVEKIIDWENSSVKQVEIPFKPARVLLQVTFSILGAAKELLPWMYDINHLGYFFNLFFLLTSGFYWSPCCC